MKSETNNAQTGKLFKIADLNKQSNPDLRRAQQVNLVVSYILEKEKCFSPEKAMSTPEIQTIYQEIKKTHPNVYEIPLNSLAQYMSVLANDSDSKISCDGKRKGYYLNLGSSFNSQTGNKAEIKTKEKDLYPILEEWLSFQCERVKDIANSRKGGQWWNPDILGISYLTFFGNQAVEITTIEAKRDLSNWRRDFFEAVSHSMFANKAYYAYLCRQSDKKDKDLFLYAQQFGIGLIAIEIPDDKWGENIDIKIEYVKEIFPAPVHNVAVRFQKEFLSNFEIRDVEDIQKFGKSNKDFEK